MYKESLSNVIPPPPAPRAKNNCPATLCCWALMENVMLFLASSPDGVIHILSTGVTISVYLASLCRAQKWGIRMGSCKDSEMESHKSHQPLLHSITLWGQGKELDFDCSSHLWFVVSQCIILGLSVRVYLDPFTFPRKVLQSILLIHVWFNQGGKLSLRTKSISPWCFPIIPHSDSGLKLFFISPTSDSRLFSLRMWNVSNIFCLRWPLAWVSAWILLVGTYEEASSFTFSCFLQFIQLSGFVFSSLIWVEIVKEKGQKKIPSWWMYTLRQLNFCLFPQKHLWSSEFFWGLWGEKNHLNLSEKSRE